MREPVELLRYRTDGGIFHTDGEPARTLLLPVRHPCENMFSLVLSDWCADVPRPLLNAYLPLLLRRGDRAELLQQGQHIKVEPRLDDLAFGEARHIDAGHPHRLASGRHALQRTSVRGARNPAGGNPVSFADLIRKGDVPIAKAAAKDTGDHFQAFRPVGPATWRCVRVMNDVIASENLVGNG